MQRLQLGCEVGQVITLDLTPPTIQINSALLAAKLGLAFCSLPAVFLAALSARGQVVDIVDSSALSQVSTTETTITVNLELSETGTAWCQARQSVTTLATRWAVACEAVRHGFNAARSETGSVQERESPCPG